MLTFLLIYYDIDADLKCIIMSGESAAFLFYKIKIHFKHLL